MTPEEREALIAYTAAVEEFAKMYARQFEGLKMLLLQKGLITTEELENALQVIEAAIAVDEATDPRFDASERWRGWFEDLKRRNESPQRHGEKRLE